MDNYGVTYPYFQSMGLSMEEADFTRLLPLAVRRLEILTHQRAHALKEGDYRLSRMRDAICNLVSYLALQEKNPQSKGITSISNDGYSESYANVSAQVAETNLQSLCRCWLSGTGLMSAL